MKITEFVKDKKVSTISSSARSSRGRYSIGIVNSPRNGKRVTFSASLSADLKLEEKVYVTSFADDGFVLIGATPFCEASVEYKLSGEGKKISYSAGLVTYLAETFDLDYSSCVSKSFVEIELDPSVSMAVVRFLDATDGAESEMES